MADGYHHLTYGSRCQIYALRESGLSLRGIGRQLRVPVSTISREVRRNSGQRGYRHLQAHGFAVARRREASSRPRKMTAALWAVVEEKLGLQWSPEQIFRSSSSPRRGRCRQDVDLPSTRKRELSLASCVVGPGLRRDTVLPSSLPG